MTDEQIIKAKELIEKLKEAYDFYYDVSRSMPYDIDVTLRESSICFQNCLDEINRQKEEIQRLENQVAINKGATRAYREAFEKAHDEAVADFSHFLIDKAKDGIIEIYDLTDLVAEWRSPKRKDAELMKEVGEAFQEGVKGGAEE